MDAHIDKELARLREERMEEVHRMQEEREREKEQNLLKEVVNGLDEINMQMKNLQEKQSKLQEVVMLLVNKKRTEGTIAGYAGYAGHAVSPSPLPPSSLPATSPAGLASPVRETTLLSSGHLADIIKNSTTVSKGDEAKYLSHVAVPTSAGVTMMTPPRRL
eukprot:TRINITY_DN37061_c0_g1_i1.p2 TRINITY_DN37061_c0_g1~~TRINITY_DN37061_c0_g1_i1.p2  ORF type:complete len:161 (+),score=48.43 TRINITY_DN37061_c0_g1_i1:51-533(+)